MDLSSLGMKIKLERKEQGLTLESLSEKAGISRNFLWEIEAGRKAPSLPTLRNLGVILNISIDYLLDLSAEKRSAASAPHMTERDMELARIMKEINGYSLKELLLISNVISDFSKYFGQK